MANMIKAQDLAIGDLIDLEEVFEEVDPGDLDSDIHLYELAVVEAVSIESDGVLIYTDQHNVLVPVNFTIDVGE